jgi:hypothetical protein
VGFKISEDIPDQTFRSFAKNLDLSVGAGLGFQSAGGFGIGARYMAGLSKVGRLRFQCRFRSRFQKQRDPGRHILRPGWKINNG